jgi:hypothetical protein
MVRDKEDPLPRLSELGLQEVNGIKNITVSVINLRRGWGDDRIDGDYILSGTRLQDLAGFWYTI